MSILSFYSTNSYKTDKAIYVFNFDKTDFYVKKVITFCKKLNSQQKMTDNMVY